MTPGVRALLLQLVKWVLVPVALLAVGYFILGPYVVPKVAGRFIKPKEIVPRPESSRKQVPPAERSTENKQT